MTRNITPFKVWLVHFFVNQKFLVNKKLKLVIISLSTKNNNEKTKGTHNMKYDTHTIDACIKAIKKVQAEIRHVDDGDYSINAAFDFIAEAVEDIEL